MTTTMTHRPSATTVAQQRPAPHGPGTPRTGRIEVRGPLDERYDEILTSDALRFIAELHDRFALPRQELLTADRARLRAIELGADPSFPAETAAIREDPDWRVAGAGPSFEDRRVVIAAPTDRDSALAALDSGANVWLADHEDGMSPTWENVIGGQLTLADAIRGRFEDERTGGWTAPAIAFRPRGWHLEERHLRYTDANGRSRSASASLVDAGLYLFHNARELVARGSSPFLALPKLESRFGARLWDEVLSSAERTLGLPHGTVRATALIETITAAFEMEEILYELRDHCAGLVAGRWDYLFSIIKHYRDRGRSFLLPDRGTMDMTAPFMRAYTELFVATCHRRGAHAVGSMSAIDPESVGADGLLGEVSAEKQLEATAGFDGTWVAHPGLVDTARHAFDAALGARPHQLERRRDDVHVTEADLLDFRVPDAGVTVAGVTENVSSSLRYLDAWLRGDGSPTIDGVVEDASMAELSRGQLWQWIHQGALTEDGLPVVRERVEWIIDAQLRELPRSTDDRLDEAAELLRELVLGEAFPMFLTIGAYERHLDGSRRGGAAAAA